MQNLEYHFYARISSCQEIDLGCEGKLKYGVCIDLLGEETPQSKKSFGCSKPNQFLSKCSTLSLANSSRIFALSSHSVCCFSVTIATSYLISTMWCFKPYKPNISESFWLPPFSDPKTPRPLNLSKPYLDISPIFSTFPKKSQLF